MLKRQSLVTPLWYVCLTQVHAHIDSKSPGAATNYVNHLLHETLYFCSQVDNLREVLTTLGVEVSSFP